MAAETPTVSASRCLKRARELAGRSARRRRAVLYDRTGAAPGTVPRRSAARRSGRSAVHALPELDLEQTSRATISTSGEITADTWCSQPRLRRRPGADCATGPDDGSSRATEPRRPRSPRRSAPGPDVRRTKNLSILANDTGPQLRLGQRSLSTTWTRPHDTRGAARRTTAARRGAGWSGGLHAPWGGRWPHARPHAPAGRVRGAWYVNGCTGPGGDEHCSGTARQGAARSGRSNASPIDFPAIPLQRWRRATAVVGRWFRCRIAVRRSLDRADGTEVAGLSCSRFQTDSVASHAFTQDSLPGSRPRARVTDSEQVPAGLASGRMGCAPITKCGKRGAQCRSPGVAPPSGLDGAGDGRDRSRDEELRDYVAGGRALRHRRGSFLGRDVGLRKPRRCA